MIKIITAIGNEELNNILKEQKNIKIENPDIQYQEGIIEALEKYPETNTIILSENIIGNLKIEELIQNIIIIKNNIKIILLCQEKIYEENENLIKTIKYDEDYIKIILKIFSDEKEIKNKNEIQNYKNNLLEKNINKKIEYENYKNKINEKFYEEEIKNNEKEINKKIINKKTKEQKNFYSNNIFKKIKLIIKNIKEKFIKNKKYIITIIGCSGVRKNNFYFHIF